MRGLNRSIYLTHEQWEVLDALAHERGWKRNRVIVAALAHYFRILGVKWPRNDPAYLASDEEEDNGAA